MIKYIPGAFCSPLCLQRPPDTELALVSKQVIIYIVSGLPPPAERTALLCDLEGPQIFVSMLRGIKLHCEKQSKNYLFFP